jgi:hypothetical protein
MKNILRQPLPPRPERKPRNWSKIRETAEAVAALYITGYLVFFFAYFGRAWFGIGFGPNIEGALLAGLVFGGLALIIAIGVVVIAGAKPRPYDYRVLIVNEDGRPERR